MTSLSQSAPVFVQDRFDLNPQLGCFLGVLLQTLQIPVTSRGYQLLDCQALLFHSLSCWLKIDDLCFMA